LAVEVGTEFKVLLNQLAAACLKPDDAVPALPTEI
jgi:hypothetical protein